MLLTYSLVCLELLFFAEESITHEAMTKQMEYTLAIPVPQQKMK